MGNNILSSETWEPLKQFGFTHNFWTIQWGTIKATIVVLLIISIASFFINRSFKKKNSMLQFAALKYVDALKSLCLDSLKSAPVGHVSFISSLFTFIFLCNTVQIFPWFVEPTKDLNTTLALSLISFFYVQIASLNANGLKGYLQEFIEPFFVMLPLHVIGKLSSIISLAFRLFGNIFGGYIVTHLYMQLVNMSVFSQTLGLISGMNLAMLFIFGLFEGGIQAFVFSILTLTYLTMEIVHEKEEEIPIDLKNIKEETC